MVMMGSPEHRRWPEQRDKRLRTLVDDGLSASQIAAELGHDLTRNAVIGRMKRMGLKSHNLPNRGNGISARSKRTRGSGSRDLGTAQRIRAKTNGLVPEVLSFIGTLAEFNAAIPKGQRKTLVQLEACHCRFPLWSDRERSGLYCGHRSADMTAGRPYCPTHESFAGAGYSAPSYIPR